MKKIAMMMFASLLATATMASSQDDTMTKQNGMYVVNTTAIGSHVEGYNGPTPVKVYIKKNKVVKVEVLKNQESPKYLAKVKQAILEKWNNLKVKNAAKQQVDAVTGATYTSEAIIKNVQIGLDYYNTHKK